MLRRSPYGLRVTRNIKQMNVNSEDNFPATLLALGIFGKHKYKFVYIDRRMDRQWPETREQIPKDVQSSVAIAYRSYPSGWIKIKPNPLGAHINQLLIQGDSEFWSCPTRIFLPSEKPGAPQVFSGLLQITLNTFVESSQEFPLLNRLGVAWGVVEWHVAPHSDLRETHQMRNTRIKHGNSACPASLYIPPNATFYTKRNNYLCLDLE